MTIVLDALRDTVGREVHRAVRAAIQWRALTVPELRHPELAAYERLDAEGQRAETLRRVRHLLFRAYHTVPFYKVAFDAAGLTPRDIRTLDDLAQVPLLDRASVRAAGNDLASRGRARIGARWNATGGSTGEPLRFLVSRWSDAAIPAADRRIWQWHGIPDGGRIALFWGADRDVPPTDDARRWQNQLLGALRLNAFWLDAQRCREFLHLIEEFRPDVVYGYATALGHFARFLEDLGRPLACPPVAIRSAAEVLVPAERTRIEKWFGAPVHDYYGGRDLGPVACECRQQSGLHVLTDLAWVEVVGPGGSACPAGEPGEVVVTKLSEHAMPLIRYRTGDRAAWLAGDCACGRPLPRLTQLQGRVGDFIRTPTGREVHGEFFTHLFYAVAGVARFQVRQEAIGGLRVLVEAQGTVAQADLDRIQSACAERCEMALSAVQMECVAAIPTSASGKHRFVLPLDAPAPEVGNPQA